MSRPAHAVIAVGIGIAAGALAITWSRTRSDASTHPAVAVEAAHEVPAPRLASPPPTPPPDPFVTLAGRWRGIGHQHVPRIDWDVDLVLGDKHVAIGETIGTVAYPSLGCSGELVRRADEGDVLVIDERITVNPDGRCVSAGRIKISRPDGDLEWVWYFTNGIEAARGRLSRV